MKQSCVSLSRVLTILIVGVMLGTLGSLHKCWAEFPPGSMEEYKAKVGEAKGHEKLGDLHATVGARHDSEARALNMSRLCSRDPNSLEVLDRVITSETLRDAHLRISIDHYFKAAKSRTELANHPISTHLATAKNSRGESRQSKHENAAWINQEKLRSMSSLAQSQPLLRMVLRPLPLLVRRPLGRPSGRPPGQPPAQGAALDEDPN